MKSLSLKGRYLQVNLTGNDNSIKVYFSGRIDTTDIHKVSLFFIVVNYLFYYYKFGFIMDRS